MKRMAMIEWALGRRSLHYGDFVLVTQLGGNYALDVCSRVDSERAQTVCVEYTNKKIIKLNYYHILNTLVSTVCV